MLFQIGHVIQNYSGVDIQYVNTGGAVSEVSFVFTVYINTLK